MRPDRVTNLRTRPSFDLEEHRQFAQGLGLIESMAWSLLRKLGSSGAEVGDGPSDQDAGEQLRQRALARRERARVVGDRLQREMLRGRARRLIARARSLAAGEAWLVGVSSPRTALAPTPTFRRVPAYARAFRILKALHDLESSATDGVKDRFKTTPALYEAWVFASAALLLCEQLAPGDVEDVRARLGGLRRGDRIEIRAGQGRRVICGFEPVIPTLDDPGAPVGSPYRAALSSAPLRPDVWLEARVPGRPARVAILDAKCSARFRSGRGSGQVGEELERMRDYRSRIVDPLTGRQPVRASFQVHYLSQERPVCNVGQLLAGKAPHDAFLTGAVGAAPGEIRGLDRVLRRLVDWLLTSG